MRRTDPARFLSALAGAAVVGLALTACGGGGDDAPVTSEAPSGPSAAAAKALTQAELPTGLTVATVSPDNAFLSAAQAVQQIQDTDIKPEGCKAKNVAAQEEVRDTVKSGSQQTVARGDQVLYGVTLLSEAKLSVFEAAGTGECSDVTFGGTAQQRTERQALPGGVDAQGFVLGITRGAGEQKTESASAYFAKNGITALVNANPGTDGKIDRAAFDDLVKRVATKL